MAKGWMPEGMEWSPRRVKKLLHVIQTGSGIHPTAYPMGTDLFPRG
jgi:hypothetical protein